MNVRVNAGAKRKLVVLALSGLAGILLWLGGAAAAHVYAQSGTDSAVDLETLARANQLYESGSFADAAQLYQQIIDKGRADSTVYYNAGNAYFRQSDLGRAVLNYERAARLQPRDEEIRTNLAVANSAADGSTVVNSNGAGNRLLTDPWWMRAQSRLTRSEAAILALGFWLLCGGLFWLYRRTRATSVQYGLVLSAVLLMGSMVVLGSQLYADYVRPQAIVIEGETDVRSGPGAHFAPLYTLHSGAKVTLLERQDAWVHLAWTGEPDTGWAPATAVEAIYGRPGENR